MTSILSVRSVVADPADRPAFDEWYANDHAMTAYRAFAPIRFWRCWSDADPAVHYVYYEFDSVARITEVSGSPEFAELVADFTNTWGDRVSRSRDIVSVVHEHP
jgi:hypothetical protein